MGKLKSPLILLSIIVMVILLLTACSSGNPAISEGSGDNSTEGKSNKESSELADEQVLDISLSAEPPTLHPAKLNNVTSIIVLDQIFDGLTRLGPDGEPELAMASDIQVSDDKKRYTFTIREDAKWTNGDPVTAKDFEYAWKYQLDPENAEAPNAYLFYIITNAEKAKKGEVAVDEVGINAVDDHTLEVTLKYPVPYFKKLIAGAYFYPVNHKVAEENPDWALEAGKNYVTNGPFKLVDWEHKNKLVLKKFEDYWDAETVKLETINMPIITDPNTEHKMYQQGDLDFAGNPTGKLPLAAIPTLKKEGKLKADFMGGTYYYTFNIKEKPFNNVNIRKAFTYAINREAIVENITQSGEEPALNYIAPTIWDESEPYFKDNDIAKAKELLQIGLEELGYSSVDEFPAITLSYNTSEEHAAIAQAIQDMWKENLGVEVILENNEWGVYLDKLATGDYQVGRLGNSVQVADAYTMLETYQELSGDNYTNWTSGEFNKYMEASITETDPDKRTEFLKKAEGVLMDEMPILPLYYYMSAYVTKDYVHNIKVRNGYIQFKWAYISEH
ncbi:peptide ABC transporter substrate-binding protein [Virgibacillus ndiopensis]|uniref:peptide ABC transporter substrate-binding protein n=1 Tax=Virgibacillus ndiopensis TaxID=2004408 RepID=UPI001FE62E1B|nr:peptide ABC transporter substrate-binding protein [Virgibacillus ndiopensis]